MSDGAALLRDLLDATEVLLTRYVVFRSLAQRTAVTLWIAHAHALDAFDVTPYLHIKSPEKECGKTRALEVVGLLVPRPWPVVGPSEAVLFRKIEKHMPTLFFDEVDNVFIGPKAKTPEAGGLRQVLNAGYRRGAVVPRCGGKHNEKLIDFRVFCAKMLAGIGDALPDTVASRCVPIALRRRKASERVAKFKFRTYALEAKPLRTGFERWAEEAVEQLRGVEPPMPDGLGDRAEEVWEPLVVIADLAGGEWPSRARLAALELNGGEPDTESYGVTLLRAIFESFALDTDRVFTGDLLDALVEREGEPWGSWWGRDLTEKGNPCKPARDLAKHLKPFGAQPQTIRIRDRTGKGYVLADLEEAFSRYLAGVGRHTVTTVAAQGFAALPQGVGGNGGVTPETLGAQGLSPCDGKNPKREPECDREPGQDDDKELLG